MPKRLRPYRLRTAAVLLLAAALPLAARAQVVERPVPFDSAGRVTALTPALARRLALAPPAWPVTGVWSEARLFEGGGQVVLVVHREDGAQERRTLSAAEVDALRAAVIAGALGVARGEDPDQASRSAKGAFIRDQLVLSAALYAPALSELTNDESAGLAVYLLATGGAFFGAAALAKDIDVTRAQQFLARDGAFRGWLTARAIADIAGVDPEDSDAQQNVWALSAVVGGIGGSVVGFNFGRPLTDGEARATALTSTTMAVTVLGTAGTLGLLDSPPDGTRRLVTATTVAAGLAGYPLGRGLGRRAGFTLTGGDVRATRLGGILGAAAGFSIASPTWEDGGQDAQRLSAALGTVGWLGGLVVGGRAAARPFDYTEGEAFLVELGAGAGALMGLALPVLAEADEAVAYTALPTIGAALGALAAHNLVAPRRALGRPASIERPVRVGRAGRRARAAFSAEGAAMAAAGVPGRHVILGVTF